MAQKTTIKAASLAALFFLSACDHEVAVVEMHVVASPPGAAMLTMDVVTLGGADVLVAPTPQKLLVRDTGSWQAVDSQLLPSFQMAPFESLRSSLWASPFPRSRSFCAADGRLWFLGRPIPQQDPQLWVSIDAGRTFNPAELPVPRPSDDNQEIIPNDPFWIRCVDRNMYVLHSRDVWLYGTDVDKPWTPLTLTGVDFKNDTGLPPVIRSYLPRTETRPFEVLSLLSDQLYFWRRNDPEEPWILTSTFGSAERDLIGSPTSAVLWLFTPTAIYQSDDQAEQWYRISPEELSGIETLESFRADETHSFLLAGTTAGSIWRHDGVWTTPRPVDTDARSVVSFVRRGDTLWAPTLGLGALRSDDLGVSWDLANEGANNTSINDLAFGPSTVVLATSSGAYERPRDAKDDMAWTRLHSRAATSIDVTSKGQVLVGTRAGDILTGSRNEPQTTPIPLSKNAPVFELEPDHELFPSSAVVEIRSIGDFALAVTHRDGAAVSSDGGMTWQVYDFASALISTLSSSSITHFLLGVLGQTLYLAETSVRRGTPTQLWRSTDSGASWSAVRSLQHADDESRVWLNWAGEGKPPLYSAQNNVLARSRDGERWEVIDGPWRSSRIVGMDVQQGHGLILAESGARHVLYDIPSVDDMTQVERLFISWPGGSSIGDIRTMRLNRRKVYVLSDDTLMVGTLPASGPYGRGMASTITATLVVVTVALGFGILKRFAR